MAEPDYYHLLDLPKSATEEEIKTVYRQLARTHHPDRGGDAEKFKALSDAYAVLSDPARRQAYDYARTKGRVVSLNDEISTLVDSYFQQFSHL